MASVDPEDTGGQAFAELVAALGHEGWRERQAAVDRLTEEPSPRWISYLVQILRESNRDLSRLNAAIQVLARTEIDVVPGLADLLHDPDADLRTYVALTLGERGDPRAIAALIAALGDADTNVRVHATEALGKLRAAEAVDRLLGFVESLEFELAFPALDALAAIGDERVAHRLLPVLEKPLLAGGAAEALGALGGEEAILPLLGLVGDAAISRAKVSAATVARAMHQIYTRQETRYGSGQTIADLVRHAGTPALLESFRAALATANRNESEAVIAVIGWFDVSQAETFLIDCLANAELRQFASQAIAARGSAIVPALLQRFETASDEARLSILDLLGLLADRGSIPMLVACLESDDDAVLSKTLNALTRMADERMYGPVKALLGHPNPLVRQGAVAAINSLGDARTAGDIQSMLEDPSPRLRDSAVRVAAYFGFDECIDSILACCDDSDERVQRTTIEHLPCLDDDRIAGQLERALHSDSPSIRAAAAGALGELDPNTASKLLHEALADPDVWVRYFAVRSLTQLHRRGESLAQFLAMAKNDPATQVRIAALEALGDEARGVGSRGVAVAGIESPATRAADPEAEPEAFHFLASLARSGDEDLAATALAALGAMRHPHALPILEAVLFSKPNAGERPFETSEREPVRLKIEAIRALGEVGLAGTVSPLRKIARGRCRELAEEAIVALGRIPMTESIEALLEILRIPDRRSAAVAALKGIGQPAIPELACRLQQQPLDVRRAVVEVLIGIHSNDSIALLETALEDPQPAVRHFARSALAYAGRAGSQHPGAFALGGD